MGLVYEFGLQRIRDLFSHHAFVVRVPFHYYYFSLYSGRFLIEKEFQSLLGGIERDQMGQIIFARAIEFKIIGYMNGTAAKMQEIQADSALGEYVSNSVSSVVEI